MSKHKIPVVLIDTADKRKRRRLLKNSPSDKVGVLQLKHIAKVESLAKTLGVKVLWAGGITLPREFEMGKRGVLGIYVTSAAAVAKPVAGDYRRDIMLAREKEPTFRGVYRVKLLLESALLVSRLRRYGFADLASTAAQSAKALVKA